MHCIIINYNMNFALVLLLGFPMTFWLYLVIEQITNWSIYNYLKQTVNRLVEEFRIYYHRMPYYVYGTLIFIAIGLYIINYNSINTTIENISSLIIKILSTPIQLFPRTGPLLHTYPYACRYAFVRRVPDPDEINGQFF